MQPLGWVCQGNPVPRTARACSWRTWSASSALCLVASASWLCSAVTCAAAAAASATASALCAAASMAWRACPTHSHTKSVSTCASGPRRPSGGPWTDLLLLSHLRAQIACALLGRCQLRRQLLLLCHGCAVLAPPKKRVRSPGPDLSNQPQCHPPVCPGSPAHAPASRSRSRFSRSARSSFQRACRVCSWCATCAAVAV